MTAYYNEIDKNACLWLQAAMDAGIIAKGDIDSRPIQEVTANDLYGYTQHHFFAGIGGWSIALRLAGWRDERPVWTGSCPCQPFSTAGRQKGKNDERHLWPHWFRLIRECKPDVVFGEQVAAAIGTTKSSEVQEMWRGEAIIQFLHQQSEREGIPQESVQFLRSVESCITKKTKQSDFKRIWQNVESAQPWKSFNFFGETAVKGKKHSVLARRNQHTKNNRQRCMPTDGDTFQPNGRKNMGLTVAGSNIAREGLHCGKHQSHHSRRQCDDEQLGSQQDIGSCGRNSSEFPLPFGLFAAEIRRKLKESSTHWWLDEVANDMESEGYAVASAVLPACSVGAPHKRDRLWFVGDSKSMQRHGSHINTRESEREKSEFGATDMCSSVGYIEMRRLQQHEQFSGSMREKVQTGACNAGGSCPDYVADTERLRQQGQGELQQSLSSAQNSIGEADRLDHFNQVGWVECPDGKARPVEPSICLLVDGIPSKLRKAALHGYGNAIVPQVGAVFIKAFMEVS